MMKKSVGLCITIFMLMIPNVLPAQDTDNGGPEVIVEISPEMPTTGAPCAVTLLIDHPLPDEVSVIAPPFIPSLFFDRLVKSPRAAEERVWTAVEYRFIPNSRGLFILEPFTIICPSGTIRTNPVVLDVGIPAEQQKTVSLRIVWEGAPSQMTTGGAAAFALRINGMGSWPPGGQFFMPEVPRGAILESLPLTAEERAGGIAIKLNFIPMESGVFSLPARVLSYEGLRLEIPGLRIRVNDSPAVEEPDAQAVTVPDGDADVRFPDFDFAAAEKNITSKTRRRQCETIYDTARDLWGRGLYARALAELRRNERDHPAGALLQPIRREAEEKLGLFNTENENRDRRKLLMFFTIFLFLFVIISLFVCLFFLRHFFRKRAVSNRKLIVFFSAILAVLGLFCLFRLMNSRGVNGKSSRFGVTHKTPVRRTADYAGEEYFIFREGQPVIILHNSSTWLNVRANDASGGSGWIPADAVIFY